MSVVSRFISYLFHPIFAPIFSVFILFQLPTYLNYKHPQAFYNFIYAILFLNLVLAPLLISVYLKRKKVISSLEMPEIKERQIPYLCSSIFYGLTYYLLEKVNFPPLYLSIFKACCIAVLLLFLLSLVQLKTSAHLTAIGGICGMLIVVSISLQLELTLLLILFIMLAGVVATSRYALKAHTFMELLAGYSIGMGAQLVLLLE